MHIGCRLSSALMKCLKHIYKRQTKCNSTSSRQRSGLLVPERILLIPVFRSAPERALRHSTIASLYPKRQRNGRPPGSVGLARSLKADHSILKTCIYHTNREQPDSAHYSLNHLLHGRGWVWVSSKEQLRDHSEGRPRFFSFWFLFCFSVVIMSMSF